MWSEDFEIVSVVENENSFRVLVEFSDRSRRGFRFPYEDKYFVESDGVPFFVSCIRDIVGERVVSLDSKKKIGISSLSKVVGLKCKARKPDLGGRGVKSDDFKEK